MANCYICSGFIHNPDKKVVLKRTYHNNCWNRLDRETRKNLESAPKLYPLPRKWEITEVQEIL